MAKRQTISLVAVLVAYSTVLGAPTSILEDAGKPAGTLWAGLAQMSVSDSKLDDTGPETERNNNSLTKLTSTLFGGETADPNRAGQPDSAGTRELFIKMMVSVVLVGVLGTAAIYGSKKLAGKLANMPGKRIKILETAHLGPRKAVHLLKVGDRCLLIGSTNDNITRLADLTTEILMHQGASSNDPEDADAGDTASSADFIAGLGPSDSLAELSRTYTENN